MGPLLYLSPLKYRASLCMVWGLNLRPKPQILHFLPFELGLGDFGEAIGSKMRRNEDFRDKVGDASIVDKTRKARLRWFGHVMRRSAEAPVRRCERLDVVGKRRGSGRLKNYWGER
ncbi:uncharacterized protein LOC125845470 [Solanum stenotomum]|uniref:uncharacterized protein LOC125845470 n=1 Tax=Solanum stenotomum TaxID=172797 RepID=UPI0020D0E08F|nr:uncharacterized protein LOC125845470 [Solanum stenotomum]